MVIRPLTGQYVPKMSKTFLEVGKKIIHLPHRLEVPWHRVLPPTSAALLFAVSGGATRAFPFFGLA